MAKSVVRKCRKLGRQILLGSDVCPYALHEDDDEMSTRGVRIWRRVDAMTGLSLLVEHARNEKCLLVENNACLEIGRAQFEDWKQGSEKVADAYGMIGILRTKDESYLITVKAVLSAGQLYNSDIYKVTSTEFIPLRTVGSAENIDARIPDLQKLISSGMFYFSASSDFDLTLNAQKRASGEDSDERFFWNRSLHFPLQRFGIDSRQWFLRCITGSVLIRTVYVGAKTGRVAVLSRLSCERVGTRFNVRGANDLGAVANFVETEQLVVFEGHESSFVQIRGSIPLFWDQPGIQVGSHKVKLRAFEASAPAYKRKLYSEVGVVNLLGSKEGERILADAFRTQHKTTHLSEVIPFIDFDYHAEMKASRDNINFLKKKLHAQLEKHGFFHMLDGTILRRQTGVIRTNCLDCLDRTNCVQTVLGLQLIREQVAAMKIESSNVNMAQRFEEILKDVWVKNGDQCSIIYAGTGALEGKSKLKDASRSIARTLQNNLMDHSKQESFDLFLCGTSFDNALFDRAANLIPHTLMQEYPDAVEQLVERSNEITIDEKIKVFCGTWNVNGGKNVYNVAFAEKERLADWIFPQHNDLDCIPDIVAVGLEELVDLNAQNMVKTSTTNQRIWLDGLRKTLHEKAPYVLLGCEQLMGVCLYVFIRPRLAAALKDFAVGSVKTGMGGATANKGSVAFRLVIHSTSLCFVCSHFAAGQNEVKDRNEDWLTAMRKLRFPQGRSISSSDVIFWFGDFNYRISMGREDVKRAIAARHFDELLPADQLTQQRAASNTFVGFEEGALDFAPTYKYDTFSNDYDTSEKCRVPAWTDRVLWRDARGKKATTRLLRYGRAELSTSDHRPVFAIFEANVYRVELSRCEALVEDIVSSMGPPDGTVICTLRGVAAFPSEAVRDVVARSKELGLQLLTSKLDGAALWLIYASGECALAALSMDGVAVGAHQLAVVLRSPDWCEKVRPRLAQYDVTAEALDESEFGDAANEFIFDDDDEAASDTTSVARLSLLSTGPPERPRPPSRGSNNGSVPPERPARPERPERPPAHLHLPTSSSAVQLASLDWPDDDSASSYSMISSSCPPRRPISSSGLTPLMPSRIAPPLPAPRPSSGSSRSSPACELPPFSQSYTNGVSAGPKPLAAHHLVPRDPFSAAWDDDSSPPSLHQLPRIPPRPKPFDWNS